MRQQPKLTFHVLHRSGWIGDGDRPRMEEVMDCTNCPTDKLLPPGVKVEQPSSNLQTLQAEADAKGVLLPTQYNRRQKPAKPKDVVSDNMLLPPGVGRG
ncbi:MAG: hypothetical protein IH975_05385 [Nitrospinae bacterium]|nr:hypothetical protein [Nitrospinota bacterium]